MLEEFGQPDIWDPETPFPWAEIDLIFVCTPPTSRGLLEEQAVANDVPFFVEKPIALHSSQLENLRSALATRPVVNAVGYMNRYRASVQRLKTSIEADRTIAMSAQWTNSTYKVPWWGDKRSSGGPVNEQATHFVDLARFLFGEIAAVSALTQPHYEHRDLVGTAAINLQFANGLVGSMLYSCQAEYKSIAFRAQTMNDEHLLEGWELADRNERHHSGNKNEIFEIETNAFVDAVLGEQDKVLSDVADAIHTQVVMDSIAEAISSGEVVLVPSVEADD